MEQAIKRFPGQPAKHLTDTSKEKVLGRIRDTRPVNQDVWIFAYGSLMWNPCFKYKKRVEAVLPDYERKFHIWSCVARGTSERPGLGLCLEKTGKKTIGVAFQIEDKYVEKAWAALWEREMTTGIYHPEWVSIIVCNDLSIKALAFVVDDQHIQYAGKLPEEEMAWIIAGASGTYGRCRDYLAMTVSETKKIGDCNNELIKLLKSVDKLMS